MRLLPRYTFPALVTVLALAQDNKNNRDPLEYFFNKKYGQVEVGGPYVGVEFHESRPLPSRISFFYPVANSIDVSTDYWKRGASAPMAIAIRIGEQQRTWVGNKPWNYTLSPHRVTFESNDDEASYQAEYDFCKNQPAMVFSFTVKNISNGVLPVELYTRLLVALRTCQTYARRDSAWTDYDSALSTLGTHFDDADTKRATVFVQNVGTMPTEWTSSAEELSVSDSGISDWAAKSGNRLRGTLHSAQKRRPVAAFVYGKNLNPSQSMTAVQVIGSCNRKEVKEKTELLASSWKNEVLAYESFCAR